MPGRESNTEEEGSPGWLFFFFPPHFDKLKWEKRKRATSFFFFFSNHPAISLTCNAEKNPDGSISGTRESGGQLGEDSPCLIVHTCVPVLSDAALPTPPPHARAHTPPTADPGHGFNGIPF